MLIHSEIIKKKPIKLHKNTEVSKWCIPVALGWWAGVILITLSK